MLTVLWLVAVLVGAIALAYVNASGIAWTAAIAVALGVAWVAHLLPPWLALALTAGVRAARDSAATSRAAAQADQRRRPRRVPQDPAADVADRARGDRGRHRLVGRRALLRQARLAASCSTMPRADADRRGAALPRPRGRGAVRDGHRLGDDQRPPRPAAARLAVHQGQGLPRHEHPEGVRRPRLLRLRALAGDDQAVDALRHRGGDGDGARTRSGRASCSRTTAPTSRSATTCRASRRASRSPASR